VLTSMVGGSLGSWLRDRFHNKALWCREREPSTPSALGRKQSLGRQKRKRRPMAAVSLPIWF